MKKKLLISLLFLEFSLLFAQDTIKTKQIDTIWVESNTKKNYFSKKNSNTVRINTPLIETPQQIHVINEKFISDYGLSGTAEVAKFSSGVIRSYGLNNDYSFIIRGTDATNNIFRNGVGNYWWNQQLDAFLIERVEFIKGPAGFLLSNAEPGGIINEITKTANGKKHAQYFIGIGSYNLFRTALDVGDVLDKKGKWSYRFLVGGQNTNTNFDFYRSYRTFLLPSLRYEYKNNSYFDVQYLRSDGRNKHETYSNISFDGTNFYYPTNFNISEQTISKGTETDDDYFKIFHQHQFSKNIKLTSHYARVKGLYDGDYFFTSGYENNFNTIYREQYFIKLNNGLDSFQSFLDVKFNTTENIKHIFLVGVDYGKSKIKGNRTYLDFADYGINLPIDAFNPLYNNFSNLPSKQIVPDDLTINKWYGIYMQDHIKFWDKYVLTIAGRFSKYESLQETVDVEKLETKSSIITPRFGFTYLLSKQMSAYISYENYFLPQLGQKEDLTSVKPITGNNLELGYKIERTKFILNAAVFQTVKNNILITNPITNASEEKGQITARGVELYFMGDWHEKLKYTLNYAYTDAKVTKDSDENIVGYKNFGVPQHLLNGFVNYTLFQKKEFKLQMGIGGQYVVKRSAVLSGYTANEDKFKTFPNYATIDGVVSLDYKQLRLQLNCNNIFNTSYFETGWWTSTDGTNPGYFTGYIGLPSNFRLQLIYSFL